MGIGVFDLEARTAHLLHPYGPIGMGGWPPAPAWSPGGQWLAFTCTTPGAESAIWLAEVRTWRLQQIDLPPGAQAVGWVTVER